MVLQLSIAQSDTFHSACFVEPIVQTSKLLQINHQKNLKQNSKSFEKLDEISGIFEMINQNIFSINICQFSNWVINKSFQLYFYILFLSLNL